MPVKRRRPWIAWIGAPLIAAWAAAHWADRQRPVLPQARAEEATGFALVELFTSEGCSSCPPAEALLGEIDREARAASQPVFVLALHVDYWDRLGWPDRFASPEHTRRQQRYARALGLDSVYTPQMIVNGRAQLVGSRRSAARSAIAAALARPASARLALSVGRTGRALALDYALSGAPESVEVFAAITQRGAVTQVERGENGGRELRHDGVVRLLRRVGRRPTGRITLELPADLDPRWATAVAFAQDPETLEVVAAAAAVVESPPPRGS